MSAHIAAAHPGKHGDALYALPTIRALAEKHGCKVDFYTSDYCEPLRSLFEYQDCIAHFCVPKTYVIERMDMGVQPAHVPIPQGFYDAVYQLGFPAIPDRPIPDYIAHLAGVSPKPITYQVPESSLNGALMQEFIVIAPRASEDYAPLFNAIVEQSPYRVYAVGGYGDAAVLRPHPNLKVADGITYLTTAALIARAKAFVGLMSSQLVLANGFPIPRICPHDGIRWNMDHVVRSEYNYYPVHPSAEQVLKLIAETITA